MDVFERRWRLLECLLSGPKTRREIWEAFQRDSGSDDEQGLRSESCLSDDVRTLRSLGIGFRPLALEDKKTKQAYELDFQYLPLFVPPEDTEALMVACQLLKALDFPETHHIHRLLSRVPEPIKNGIVEPNLEELLVARHSPYDPEIIRSLRDGIQQSRGMMISYQAIGRDPKRYYIDKATIILQEGQLYVQAHCPREPGDTKFQQNREFRLDRFSRIGEHPIVEILSGKTKETTFPTFQMELRVSPYLAPYFTCTTNYKSFAQGDGSMIVRTQEAIVLRAVRRVLSYGDQVEVLGPDFILRELKRTIVRMAEIHSEDGVSPMQ